MSSISVIIPTYNRPHEVMDCLLSILDQTRQPDELILVDDGDLPVPPLKERFEDQGIRCLYLQKEVPGVTESKNKGVEASSGDYLFFLDDDVVLYPDYIERMMEVFENDPTGEVSGVGGWVVNPKPMTWKRRLFLTWHMLFLMSGWQEGRVLPSGYTTNYGTTGYTPRQVVAVDYLLGGVCAYRREVFQDFLFSNTYSGYGDRGEDKDFSYRVGKKHRLLLTPRAKLLHYESPAMRLGGKRRGREAVIARYRFFREHVMKGWYSWLFFWYAIMGYVLLRILIMLASADVQEVRRVQGALGAVQDIILGRLRTARYVDTV